MKGIDALRWRYRPFWGLSAEMPHGVCCIEGKAMVRPISYLLAFCLVSAITASSVKAGSRDGTDNFSSQSAIGFAALAVNDVTGTVETKTKKV